jgi:hypothetical protein
MIYVTAIRLSAGGSRPSHITRLWWDEVGTTAAGDWSVAEMVEWIDVKRGEAKVRNPYGTDAVVRTVHPVGRPSYVQTKPDDTTADNLLSLPRK